MLGAGLIAVEQSGALLTEYHRAYVEPAVHFSYPLFPWLHPWHPVGVYVHFAANSLLALLVAAGVRTRICAALLCLSLSTLFLMERGVYLNHAYLYCLFAGLLAVVPSHHAVSVDRARGWVIASSTAPVWGLWLLRFQIAVVYVFAGIAKLEPDWLAGRPMSVWLNDRAWYPVIGSWFESRSAALAMSWGGLLFDLFVIPALLWPRTRKPALLLAVGFHSLNALVFGVGTFPWFSLVATMLFLPAGFFRRLPLLRSALPLFRPEDARNVAGPGRPAVAAMVLYVAVQLAVPLRPWAAADRSVWSEEGSTFAWRMMLRDKRGSLALVLHDPISGATWRESPARYTTAWQRRTLVGSPDLILQFAHWRADQWQRTRGVRPEVRAESRVSLNGRPYRPLVDPNVDLARESRRLLSPYPFTLPFEQTDASDSPGASQGLSDSAQ